MFANHKRLVLSILVIFCVFNVDGAPEVVADFTGASRFVQYQPRHIHIGYGNEPTTQMTVTWSTLDDPNGTYVEYGRKHLAEFTTEGTRFLFVEKSVLQLKQYIHRVLLTGLTPGETYMYHVGGDLGWSEIFYFTAMRDDVDFLPHLAIYGDLGNENAVSLVRLQRETHMGVYDAVIHVGDFAYNMESESGFIGDAFMTQIQPIAGYLPYMVGPGNHEEANNFWQYKSRFTMPGEEESMFYSWNIGPIHFISISTEFFYYLKYGTGYMHRQYEWLQKDLEEANKNRDKQPWVVVYGHRPMYCSNDNIDDCTMHENLIRVGIPYLHWYGLEDMFMNTGVDLTIWAHEHSYERLWPVYNHKVYNGSLEEPYRNPKAVTHVVTGSAGCKWRHDDFGNKTAPIWTAYRTVDYGYSRMKPLNSTHLYWEQISEDLHGAVIDSFTLIRENHEPYEIPKNNANN